MIVLYDAKAKLGYSYSCKSDNNVMIHLLRYVHSRTRFKSILLLYEIQFT